MDVTIRGTTTPCVELKRGEERTVVFSDHVQRLINGGFVEVVSWHDSYSEPEPELTVTERYADYAAAQSRKEAGLPARPDDAARLAAGDPTEKAEPRKRTTRKRR